MKAHRRLPFRLPSGALFGRRTADGATNETVNRGRQLSRQKLLELAHVAVASSDSSHLQIDEALRARGRHRHIALRVPHFTVIPQILRRTDWMVTLPRGVARVFNETGQFSIYPLPVEFPAIESSVHWHATFDNDEGNRWLRELVVETLRRPGAVTKADDAHDGEAGT